MKFKRYTLYGPHTIGPNGTGKDNKGFWNLRTGLGIALVIIIVAMVVLVVMRRRIIKIGG